MCGHRARRSLRARRVGVIVVVVMIVVVVIVIVVVRRRRGGFRRVSWPDGWREGKRGGGGRR